MLLGERVVFRPDENARPAGSASIGVLTAIFRPAWARGQTPAISYR
jgi:hypothetical protein